MEVKCTRWLSPTVGGMPLPQRCHYPIYSGNPQPGYFPVNPHPRYNSGFMPESPLQKNPYAIGKSSA